MPLEMNYFNYFTEIEQEFVKRRGRHMLVSPLDWALIENWKQRGIPLHIVLRGINSSFDGYDQRKHRGRKVNSLFFCCQEVEAMFEEYCESRVGSAGSPDLKNAAASNGSSTKNGDSQFGISQLISYLKRNYESLERLREKHSLDQVLEDAFARTAERLTQIIELMRDNGVLSPEMLELDLTMIEEVILDGLKEHVGDEGLSQLRKEGKQRLRAYKQTMEREIYEQTLNNFIARQLRDQYCVPRLSLFYL